MVDARGRTPISRRLFVDILSRQIGEDVDMPIRIRGEREMKLWAIGTYGGIPCAECGKRVTETAECIRDHIIMRRLAPGNDYRLFDTADNQQYICLACHHEKTYKRGRDGLGSDASRAAKLRRVEKKADAAPRRSAKIPSRPFPKMDGHKLKIQSGKRKIPSRPFPTSKPKPEKETI